MDDAALRVVQFGSSRAQLYGDDPDPFEMAGNALQWQPKLHHVPGLYQRLGFHAIEPPVLVHQPAPPGLMRGT